ncbi:MAG: AAA family ATPase [Bacteroidota bacterium]
MKIKSITIRNYKRFKDEKTFKFTNLDGFINESTLVIGDNGKGKTSLLQAIVLLVATATRQGFTPNNLNWTGFEYRFLQNGKLPIQIEAVICFGEEEIQKTIEYAKDLIEKVSN